ncbi:FAD-binding oxidoreductase [Flindersiella endophytica]
MSSNDSEPVSTAEPITERPADLREARDVLTKAADAGRRVLIRGAGSAQSWGAPVEPTDIVLDTTGLDQIVAYNPSDMTVAVGAGISLSALQSQLRGQYVALDAARIGRGATVGGLLATGDAGPLRPRYGSLRDLVIGVTVVLADGTVARSGGHVIKNVAGYDLAKLFSGSLGAFGLLTEVVLRVHPLPESTATLAVACDPGQAFGYTLDLLGSPLEPVSVEWHGDATTGRLLVRFEGTDHGVRRRVDKAADLLTKLGASTPDVLDDAAGAEAWQAVADSALGGEGDTVFRAGTRPDRMPSLANRLVYLASEYSVEVELTSSVGIGVHTVRLSGGGVAGHAEVFQAWRSDATEAGGSVTLHRGAPGLTDLVPAWGRPPSSVEVLQALKKQLDPDNRLCPGRFAPWM